MSAPRTGVVNLARAMHCLLGSLLAVCLPSVASAQGPIPAPIDKGNVRIELAPIATA